MTYLIKNAFNLFFAIFCFQSLSIYGIDKVKIYNVRDFGAIGDGVTLDTKAFQAAIDKASVGSQKNQVLIPGGYKFLIGSIILKSNIDFHLAEGSEILISTEHKDYIGEA